jgi:hypothetical protein
MNSTQFHTSTPYHTTWCGSVDRHINKGDCGVGAVWRGHKKTAPKSGSCGVANMSPHLVWLNLLPQIYTLVWKVSTHVMGNNQIERAQAPALYVLVDAFHTTALRWRYGHGVDATTASTFSEVRGSAPHGD